MNLVRKDEICDIEIIDGVHLRFLEDLNDDGSDVEDNVGRFIWPTAMPMMKHIRETILPSCAKNIILIELGAGCGLLGMGIAATHKFHKVIITDHDALWLHRNLDLNADVLGEEVMAVRLDWGNISELDNVSTMVQEACNSVDGPNVMILASDVLYNHNSHNKLAYALRKLTSHNAPTRILIGFLNDRDNDEASFLSVARKTLCDAVTHSKAVSVERKGENGTKFIELHIIDVIVKT